jgi:hypothetical protein
MVQRENAVNFFGRELGPIDHLDPNLLSSANSTIASKDTYRFLAHLDLASRSNAGQESAIYDLVKCVLEVTGFDEFSTILRHSFYHLRRPPSSGADGCMSHSPQLHDFFGCSGG